MQSVRSVADSLTYSIEAYCSCILHRIVFANMRLNIRFYDFVRMENRCRAHKRVAVVAKDDLV